MGKPGHGARAPDPRRGARDVAARRGRRRPARPDEHDLLTFAGAIAVQALFAIIPVIASAAFLTGAQLDALVRDRVRSG